MTPASKSITYKAYNSAKKTTKKQQKKGSENKKQKQAWLRREQSVGQPQKRTNAANSENQLALDPKTIKKIKKNKKKLDKAK